MGAILYPFEDVELILDAELYKSEIETEWIQMQPILEKYEA